MIVYAREHGATFTDELFGMLRGVGVEPMIEHRVREVSTLLGMAATGVGVAVVAESLCALQSAKLVYRPLADPESITSIWLVHLSEGASLPCRNFLEIITREAEGE